MKYGKFKIIYFKRTDLYVVQAGINYEYLRFDDKTGSVTVVSDIQKATFLKTVEHCKELIAYYRDPEPCSGVVETLNFG